MPDHYPAVLEGLSEGEKYCGFGSEKVVRLCICAQKIKSVQKVEHVFSAYIKSLHPCVLQLQHQAFILTMNRLCLSMPVITSKLLGTSIIAPQKQAEKEGKNPKENHWHQFVMLTISNYGENAECTRIFFVNCILIMLEVGKLKQ